LLLVETSDTGRYGRVETDEEGLILKFAEKINDGGRGFINAGIYLLGNRFLKTIPDRYPVSLEREIFPSWIGGKLYGYKSKGLFLDIGTPKSYVLADEFITEDIG
jgi:NDP-sugar pyrophosphorylase family protein